LTEQFLDMLPCEQLNNDEEKERNHLKHSIVDIERIGDLAYNIAEFACQLHEKKINISNEAKSELEYLFFHVIKGYDLSLKAMIDNSAELAQKVLEIENEVDDLEKKYKDNHIARLETNKCNPKADAIYIETLRNLERISDHSFNIAVNILKANNILKKL
jgi:phosphate:Na+ symporter